MKRWILCVVAALAGCAADPTQLLVEVDTDLSVPLELDRIDVEIEDETGEVISSHPFEIVAHGDTVAPAKYELPISFAVAPRGGDDSRRVRVVVSGHLGDGAAVVTRQAAIGFVAHRTIPLRMFLARACVSVQCGDNETCNDGVCVPDVVDVPPHDADMGSALDGDVMNDGAVVDGGTPDLGVDMTPGCASDETLCDGLCRRTLEDAAYCGSCDNHCAAGAVCNVGTCMAVADCNSGDAACTGVTYCDHATGQCTPGCDSNTQCDASGQVCDVSSHACGCASGTHACSGACVSTMSPFACGSSCTPCPTDPHGTATCDGSACGLVCNADSRMCGGACAVCPSGTAIAATDCSGSACVATACSSGYELVSGACMPSGVLRESAYIKASNTDAGDRFGVALSISGDGNTLAVGAPRESSNGVGATRSPANNSSPAAGAVYLFRRSGGSWIQQAYIKPDVVGHDDQFGGAVDLSDDGNMLVVGAAGEDSSSGGFDATEDDESAESAGAAYVFRFTGTRWIQEHYVKCQYPDSLDEFGTSVAISGSGDTIAVGAPGEASSGTGVFELGATEETDNSVPGAGAVFVFGRLSTGEWTEDAYIKASNTDADDRFGSSVALSSDGTYLAVGAPNESSSSRSIGTGAANNSGAFNGAAYVFHFWGSAWRQQAYIKSSNNDDNDRFGSAVALSNDGSVLAVGAPAESSNAVGVGGDQSDNSASSAGAVYTFRYASSAWAQISYVKASNSATEAQFGYSVALSGDGGTLIVGSPFEGCGPGRMCSSAESGSSAASYGAVYVFECPGAVCTQRAYVKPRVLDESDGFGQSVDATDDGNVFAGTSQYESSAATGVGGDATSNAADSSGAAYVFTR